MMKQKRKLFELLGLTDVQLEIRVEDVWLQVEVAVADSSFILRGASGYIVVVDSWQPVEAQAEGWRLEGGALDGVLLRAYLKVYLSAAELERRRGAV